MAHSKTSMITQMKEQGGKIMSVLISEDAHIKPDYLSIPDGCENLRADFIRPAFYWLGTVFETEFAALMKFRRQQPDHIWTRYKTWGGFEECREVVLLKEKVNALRSAVVSRKRPDFFKKSKRAKLLQKDRVPASEGGK